MHFSGGVDLTALERRLGRLQSELIWYRGNVDNLINHDLVMNYAAQLARRYFPIRAENPIYIEPIIHSFACDLVLAPMHHRYHHLWRYDYDDLDVLSQFYKFSTPRQGYYHVAHGTLSPPTPQLFEAGCCILGARFETSDELFSAYYVEGARARVAARVIETIAGLPSDHDLNRHYGFLAQESAKRRRRVNGEGRFRFLRRGRSWMALGTHANDSTTDLRRSGICDLFGYRVHITQGDLRISVSKELLEFARAEIVTILESESAPFNRIARVNNFYERFHHQHRFANATNWSQLDQFLLKWIRKMVRSVPKSRYVVYLAAKNKPAMATYLPRRSNFFWDLSELKCPYHSLWNPYRWPQPAPEIHRTSSLAEQGNDC